MRKKSPSPTAVSRKSGELPSSTVSIEVKRKASLRKSVKRRPATGREPAAEASAFNGSYILGAVIALLALLLIGALIVIVLEKPQAAEAWKLVGSIFPPTITSLLAFLAGRYAPGRR